MLKERFMKESGRIIELMVLATTNTQMAASMRVNG